MGYDTSFHPVDHGICARTTGYILGQGDDGALDDLVADAVRIAQVRFRANAWGLGALQASPPETFQPDLHVWGRPFLVTGDGTANIAAGIDAYLAAEPGAVDEIARSMLNRLEPGFADRVTPDGSGTLPAADSLARGIRGHVDILRAAVAAQRAGRIELTVGDDHFEPAALIERDLARVVLDFATNLRPGWMSRGHTWPTARLDGTPARDLFVPNVAVALAAYEELPDLKWAAYDTIVENEMVGGCLAPGDVAAVRAAVAALPDDPDLDADRHKLGEALADAAHRGLPFAEATEIYSGIMGIMN